MCTLDIILKLIEKKGVTQQEFLKGIGLNKSALSDWKKGINSSYMKHIGKIADYFDVSVDYLLGKTNTPTQEQKDEFAKLTAQMSPEEQQKVKEYMEFLISQRENKKEEI